MARQKKPAAKNDLLSDADALRLFQTKLKWSDPHPVGELERQMLPDRPGIYIFTSTNAVRLNDVATLYVGKTDGVETSLRARAWGYCVKPAPKRCPHTGRQYIFQYRRIHTNSKGVESNLFLRWAVYSDAAGIEGALIYLLKPTFNTRIETIWVDADDIDPRYVGDPYQGAPAKRKPKAKR